MTATITSHYHVIAVQDWGGSQEYYIGKDDPLTLTEAQQLADDMVRADTIYMSGGGLDSDRAGEAEFGDRYHDLISTNVAPGWNAIWLVTCEQQCRFGEIFHGRTCTECGTTTPPPRDVRDVWGEPYWTSGEVLAW
jgi:hypothetical protein